MAVPADITRFMNNARTNLPGATDPVLQQELFNVMDDFFKRSNVWNEDIDIMIPGMDPAGTIYELTPTGPALIDKLLWVFEKPTSDSIQRGAGVAAAMSIPGELTLRLQPSSDVTYRVTVALTVQDPTLRNGYVTFPAWVLAKYRDCLLDGLLGRMMKQPNKPYSNVQLSVFHMRKFLQQAAAARVEWTRNNTYRAQAWAFPQGFSRGSQRGGTGWGGPVYGATMSKSDFLENAILNLIFRAVAIANLADNASASPLTSLYWSLHTADPGDAGTQSTSETNYTSYARVAVARTTGGMTASTVGSTSPAANVDFPLATGPTLPTVSAITYAAVGMLASGAGNILYSGPVTPTINVSNGVTPRLTTASTITED